MVRLKNIGEFILYKNLYFINYFIGSIESITLSAYCFYLLINIKLKQKILQISNAVNFQLKNK